MKKIAVLMSTYNGEKYIREQIDSIIYQENVEVSLIVRDDESNDATVSILDEYAKQGKLKYYQGQNMGYAKSFLWLLTQATDADYYAFADQDDVWEPDKLLNAVQMLEQVNNDKTKLYCSALTYVDKNLNYLYTKDYLNLKVGLGSAIIRLRVAGCTMVFNKSLLDIVKKCYSISNKNYGHDGWVYLLCLATGGNLIVDNVSHIKYRRHGENETSSGNGIIKRIKKEFLKFTKYKNRKYCVAKIILDNFSDVITKDSFKLLYDIVHYKDSFFNTVKLMFNKELRCGIKCIDLFNRVIILSRSL